MSTPLTPSRPSRGRTYENHGRIHGNHKKIYGNHQESSSQCQQSRLHPRCPCRGIIYGNHERIHHIHKRIYGKTPNVNSQIPGALVEGEFMEEIGAGLCSAGAPSPPIHEMIIDQGIENRILCRTVACQHIYIFLLPWHSTVIDHSMICYLTNMICATEIITVIVTR